jgi:OOP family OmpA-OmpF porin
MKIHKLFVSLFITLGLALALSASAHAEEGFYVGGAFGKAYLDENISGIPIDSDSSIYRVFGGYGFTPHLGVEVAYLDLGTFRDEIDVGGTLVPVAVSADGFQLGGVATIPVSERFSVTGRLGFFFFDGESEAGGIIEKDPSESRPYAGLGLAYGLNESVDLNLGVDYLDTDDADPVLAMLGLTVRF